jgi:hypothetical protein
VFYLYIYIYIHISRICFYYRSVKCRSRNMKWVSIKSARNNVIYILFQIWKQWWNCIHHLFLVLSSYASTEKVCIVHAVSFWVLQDKLEPCVLLWSQYVIEIRSGQIISGLNMLFLLWCLLYFVIIAWWH